MEDTPCTYRISIKALITDDQGRILLLNESDGSWELPGGGMEHGEDPKLALTRELTEETGFTVERMGDEPERFWTIYKDVGHEQLKWFAFVVYRVTISGIFAPSEEHVGEALEAKYFTVKEARSLQLHDNTKPYFA